jgi:hypothetical protein
VGASLADDLSAFTSQALVPATSPSPGNASTPLWAVSSAVTSMPIPVLATSPSPGNVSTPLWVASPADTPRPIPVPTDRFTPPAIKTGDNYLQTRDLILFWLCSPGFSTGRLDELLLTDARNALASQCWEGQLCAALKDGPIRFLFENTGSTFYGKGFEMIQVHKDHFPPSSISNSFTTLLALFNDTQGKKESIHEFRSQLEGHIRALSWSLVAIPPILQVMLFLWGMHLRYQDLLSQFVSKHKDLALATIDSIIADARFMDDFVIVKGKTKPGAPVPSPRSTPSAAAVATNKEGKAFQIPFEWLATYDSGFVMACWCRSLRVDFYCKFCSGKDKHHPLKCPLLGELGLKIIEVGGQGGGATLGSSLRGSSGSGASGGVKPASPSPPAAAPAAIASPLVPVSGSTSTPAGLTAAVEPDNGGDESFADDF